MQTESEDLPSPWMTDRQARRRTKCARMCVTSSVRMSESSRLRTDAQSNIMRKKRRSARCGCRFLIPSRKDRRFEVDGVLESGFEVIWISL
ncbi:hypothetical protein TNCT_446241 [Trichonephila clavata]|uniref:Uncharacterized protein n=1 Tax=Trichonephila clavata TaxID=2740835 RepID=A0A8X6G8J4_TRICU|nr:hypothetical protein TNCT_446241 [Trichonephila clavata]